MVYLFYLYHTINVICLFVFIYFNISFVCWIVWVRFFSRRFVLLPLLFPLYYSSISCHYRLVSCFLLHFISSSVCYLAIIKENIYDVVKYILFSSCFCYRSCTFFLAFSCTHTHFSFTWLFFVVGKNAYLHNISTFQLDKILFECNIVWVQGHEIFKTFCYFKLCG